MQTNEATSHVEDVSEVKISSGISLQLSGDHDDRKSFADKPRSGAESTRSSGQDQTWKNVTVFISEIQVLGIRS